MLSCKVCLLIIFFVHVGSTQLLECSNNEDCIPDATCQDYLCECPNNMVFSLDGSKCLNVAVGFGVPCTETNQCGWLTGNYECIDETCKCADGWVYYEGQCVRQGLFDQACASDRDCLNGYDLLAMTCRDNTCTCNDGYYLRGEYDCRPAITELDEYCSLNSDCKVENSLCINSFCTTAQSPGRNVSLELDDYSVVAVVKAEGEEMCKNCETSADCLVPNSMCYQHFKQCFCNRGYSYVAESNICLAELGVPSGCMADEDCTSQISYTRCVDGACYCRKTYFTLPGNMACQKPMTHDNFFCNTNERCYVLGPDSICEDSECKCVTDKEPTSEFICEPPLDCSTVSDCNTLINSVCISGLCTCPENYHLEDPVCLPNLGGECSDLAPCTIENAACSNSNICSCNAKFVPNGDLSCLPVVETLNATCEINEQCSQVLPNSACVESECKCSSGYGEIKGACVFITKMGDPCSDLSQCHAFLGNNVLCRNGICGCSAEMKLNEKKTDCVSSAGVLSISYFTAILLLTIVALL